MLNRKQFLGGLGCAATGALAGAYIPRKLSPAVYLQGGQESFSQCGEDVNVYFMFMMFSLLGGAKLTYLDVGAHDPRVINNTYFFYRKGFRGVLVEPNGALCKLLREARPEDTTLEAGIGISDAKEADYYLLTNSGLNTFSKEQAERLEAETKRKVKIEEIRKIPLLNINDVMEKNFQGAPSFLSIDTEGLDLDILKTLDFVKYRPKILCVETLIANTQKHDPAIGEYLATKNYTPRGGSMVNTIFLDNALLS